MISLIERVADRLLAGVVPATTAAAGECLRSNDPCRFCGCNGSRAYYTRAWHCTWGMECGRSCEIVLPC
ncbi:hypothetical protein WEH80_18920 [Actinomycetes bacterium KLBMP 9759]